MFTSIYFILWAILVPSLMYFIDSPVTSRKTRLCFPVFLTYFMILSAFMMMAMIKEGMGLGLIPLGILCAVGGAIPTVIIKSVGRWMQMHPEV